MPGRARGSRTGRSPASARSTRWSTRSRRRLPENRATGASMHYTSGTTGKPKGVKRALAEIDPDTSAELFTFLLQTLRHHCRTTATCTCSTSPNYHTAVTTFAGNSLAHEAHGRVHGQVGCRRDAAPDRALRVHAHAHGADAVHPHAAAPRRREGEVRRVGDEVRDPRGRAVPGRRQAPHARVVGPGDLGVLRRDRRRRHDRAARRMDEVPGHRRARVAERAS